MMQPQTDLQICYIVRSSDLKTIPCFTADNNILRLSVGVVLVGSIDNVFPVVGVNYSRSVFDFEHYVSINRYKVKLPAHPDPDGIRIV